MTLLISLVCALILVTIAIVLFGAFICSDLKRTINTLNSVKNELFELKKTLSRKGVI